MQKMGRIWALCLALALLAAPTTSQAASLHEGFVSLMLETDREAYDAQQEVCISLAVSNTGEEPLGPLYGQVTLPEGLEPLDGQETYFETPQLKTGEAFTRELRVRIAAADVGTLPQTGDDSMLLLWVVLAVLACAGLLCMDRHMRRRMLSMLLCAALLGSFLPQEAIASAAAEGIAAYGGEPAALDGPAIMELLGPAAYDGETAGMDEPAAAITVYSADGKIVENTDDGAHTHAGEDGPWMLSEQITVMGKPEEILMTVVKDLAAPASSYSGSDVRYMHCYLGVGTKSLSSTLDFYSSAGTDTTTTFTEYYYGEFGQTYDYPASVCRKCDYGLGKGSDYLYELKGPSGTVSYTITFGEFSLGSHDALIIYDANGNFVARYTGTALEYKTIVVESSEVTLRFITNCYYSHSHPFRVTNVIANSKSYVRNIELDNGMPMICWLRGKDMEGALVDRAIIFEDGSVGTFSTITDGYYSGAYEACAYIDPDAVSGKRYAYRIREYYDVYDDVPMVRPGQPYYYYHTTAPKITSASVEQGESGYAAQLSWSAVKNAVGYEVFNYDNLMAAGWDVVGTTYSTTYSSRPTSQYAVVAKYNYGGLEVFGPSSAPAIFEQGQLPPDVPSALAARSHGASSVYIEWTAAARADGYEVWRSKTEGGAYTKVKTTTGLYTTVSAAREGALSYYKVRAYRTIDGKKVYGAYSAPIANYPIEKPTGVAATITSGGKTKLTWDAVDGATQYRVYYSTTKNGAYIQYETAAEGTSLVLSSLPATMTTGYFKVQAVRVGSVATSYSQYSAAVAGKQVAKPEKPTDLAVRSDGQKNVYVEWNKAVDAQGYEIWRSKSKNSGYAKIRTTTGSYATLTDAPDGNLRYFKVRAYKTVDGVKVYSAYTEPVANYPIKKPEGVSAAINQNGDVKLSWNAVTNATKYRVFYSKTKDGTYTRYTSTTAGTSLVLSKLDESFMQGYFKVQAVREGSVATSYSQYSAAVFAEQIKQPEQPANLAVRSNGKANVYVLWDKAQDADGYEIWRSRSRDNGYAKVRTLTGTAGTLTDASAVTLHYYKVRSYKEVNGSKVYSAYTEPVANYPIQKPAGVTASQDSQGDVVLSWNAVDNATKYAVWYCQTKDGAYTRYDATTTGTSLALSGLPNEIPTAYFKVQAIREGSIATSYSQYSAAVKGEHFTAPAQPTGFKVRSDGDNAVVMHWEPVEGADGYEVSCRSDKANSFYYVAKTTLTDLSALPPSYDTLCYYKVRAYKCRDGVYFYGDNAQAQIYRLYKPTAAYDAEAKALTWSYDVSRNYMTSIEIEVSDSPDGPFELFDRVYGKTCVSYALSDSDMGKYYRICVTRNEFYRSVFSEVVKAE